MFSMTGLYDLYSLLLALTVLDMRFPTSVWLMHINQIVRLSMSIDPLNNLRQLEAESIHIIRE
ncbi:MAG: hypothetical protein KUG61_03460, partial [Parvibaculaceae bacterium]|nr:hypothetical protein [Parvibaculaceae bacterium]